MVAFEPPPAGAGELVGIDPAAATELGELLLGKKPGRRSDDEITLFESMGIALEDVAAARVVYERARERGIGVPLPF